MTSGIRPATQDDAPTPTQVPRRARPWQLFSKGWCPRSDAGRRLDRGGENA